MQQAFSASESAMDTFTESRSPVWSQTVKRVLGIWLLLVAWSFFRVMVPGVNEPHYLCKAKHFWNPDWCSADFFLNSSNPHLIFYLTFGWPTQWLSLTTTTVLARLVCLGVLAVGWYELTRALLTSYSRQLLALSLFLLLQTLVNFSGEWLVGGAESKVISYGFGFWGLGCLLRGQTLTAGALLGLATSYHPLVGGWLSLCTVMGVYGGHLCNLRQERLPWLVVLRQLGHHVLCRPTLLSLLIWSLCSLPGLIPAVWVLMEPVDARTKFVGDFLQVYYRLKHHLDPMEFARWRYASYAAMLLVIAGCYRWETRRTGEFQREDSRRLQLLLGLFLASLLIAFVGVLVGLRWGLPAEMPAFAFRLWLLKFYPFRIFDLLAPVVVAICLARLFSPPRWLTARLPDRMGLHPVWISIAIVAVFVPFSDRDSSRMPPTQKQHWLEVCDWIRQNTPAEAVVMTPPRSWAFKWFAQRAEYVNYKDCPQDSSGIAEWHRRLNLLRSWGQENYDDRIYDRSETTALAKETGISYIVSDRLGPFELQPVYSNPHYRVYQIAGP